VVKLAGESKSLSLGIRLLLERVEVALLVSFWDTGLCQP